MKRNHEVMFAKRIKRKLSNSRDHLYKALEELKDPKGEIDNIISMAFHCNQCDMTIEGAFVKLSKYKKMQDYFDDYLPDELRVYCASCWKKRQEKGEQGAE